MHTATDSVISFGYQGQRSRQRAILGTKTDQLAKFDCQIPQQFSPAGKVHAM